MRPGNQFGFNDNHATQLINFMFHLNLHFYFAEIANVANNLDSLNTVLDTIEERADQIRSQLLELLTSNREIRQSLREEYGQNDGQCQKLIEQLHDSSDKHNIDAEPSPPSSSSPPSSDE